MEKIKSLIGLLIVVALLFSCSTSNKVVTGNFIQKRKYNKGFYVSLKNKKQKQKTVIAAINDCNSSNATDEVNKIYSKRLKQKNNVSNIDNSLIVSNDDKFIHISSNKYVINLLSKNNETKSILSSSKVEKKLKKIKRRNDTKLKNQTKNDNNAESTPTENGKSQLIALLLVIFVGVIGIHRFYLGYVGIGVLQLLTLGGCGIWALIDLIRIITGNLKPNGGEYTETL